MDFAPGIRLPDCSKLAIYWKNDNDVIIFQHDVIVKIFWCCFVSLMRFSYWSRFHVNIIASSFIRDWPEIRKSQIPPSEFCTISGDWGKLRIPNLPRMSPIKCYWMLQNARITAFTVSELLRKNQQGIKLSPPPRLGWSPYNTFHKFQNLFACFDLVSVQLLVIERARNKFVVIEIVAECYLINWRTK